MALTHHDGISVYGSGLYVGKKGVELGPILNTSGQVQSGFIAVGAIAYGSLAATEKWDAGATGVSGNLLSISTRLSSIVTGLAQINRIPVSGLTAAYVVTSGHMIDLYTYYVTTSSLPVASSVSSPVSWSVRGI